MNAPAIPTDIVPVVTPDMISGQLAEVSRLIFAADELTEEDKENIATRLRTAASNIRIMNSLQFTDGHFIPKNAGEMWYLVDMIVKAKAAPSSYENNPATIFLGVTKALELGVDPLTGLSNIMVVNNRLSVWGDLAQALIAKSGKLENQTVEKIGDWPAEEGEEIVGLAHWPLSVGWRVASYRKGVTEPFVGEFTVADAKRAGLWMNTRKQPWITAPGRMLFNRARAISQRDGFSDCLLGLAIAEEQFDIQQAHNVTHPALAPPPPAIEDDDEPVTQLPPPPAMPDYASFDPVDPEKGPAPQADEPTQPNEGE